MEELTEADKRDIYYFWTERGSLERWSAWEEKLPTIERDYPELVQAWRELKELKAKISRVVQQIGGDLSQ